MAQRRWRPARLTWVTAVIALLGLLLLLYPAAASWISSYNQSQIIRTYVSDLDQVQPSQTEQLAQARAYNDALTAGVRLAANANIATGEGVSSDATLVYDEILRANAMGLMGRVKIPSIDVDLPFYHGTDDDTLLRGAGHLEGSHLPVGGPSTHSVITAHRGLANATMFTNLDKVDEGDRFTIEVFGEVLTYQVRQTRVVEPHDTDTLRVSPGEDIVTLITCTPLGINSHRILVTGERVTPTPIVDIEQAGEDPILPRFPWWLVALGGGFILIVGFVWRSGYTDPARIARAADATVGPDGAGAPPARAWSVHRHSR